MDRDRRAVDPAPAGAANLPVYPNHDAVLAALLSEDERVNSANRQLAESYDLIAENRRTIALRVREAAAGVNDSKSYDKVTQEIRDLVTVYRQRGAAVRLKIISVGGVPYPEPDEFSNGI